MGLHQLKLAVAIFVLSAPLHAGSQQNKDAPVNKGQECERMAMGTHYRTLDYPAKVRWMAREEMVGTEPKDAMHIRDDGETPAQKAAFDASLLRGWHMQDDHMAHNNGATRSPMEFFDDCVKGEDS